jgi:hypothetical protein
MCGLWEPALAVLRRRRVWRRLVAVWWSSTRGSVAEGNRSVFTGHRESAQGG